MPSFTFAQATDVGRVRKSNQDSAAILDTTALSGLADGLFIVADGMGGHAGGEVASRCTVESLSREVPRALSSANGGAVADGLKGALLDGIDRANRDVWERAHAQPELRGMGTTCVAALFSGETAAVANVGDSRAYLLRDGVLEQMTVDHSLVQEYVRAGQLSRGEASRSRFRNVITRGIGIARDVEPDMITFDPRSGDTLLLCTDGLTNMVDDRRIAHLLGISPTAQEACDRLMQAALDAGGEDNVTVVVVRVGTFIPTRTDIQDDEVTPDDEGFASSLANARNHELKPVSKGRNAADRIAVVLGMVCVALTAALATTLSRHYQLQSTWPFLAPLSVRKQAPPRTPPKPDYANLAYMPPVLAYPEKLLPATLLLTPEQTVFAFTSSGDAVWIEGQSHADRIPAGRAGVPKEAALHHWAADPDGNLYVSSVKEGSIRKFAPNGTRIAVIGAGDLKAPAALAVANTGDIYVIDAGHLKVLRARPANGGPPYRPAAQEKPGRADAPNLTLESLRRGNGGN